MAVNLSPYGGVGAQFLDNAGNVLTGGKIETYAAGTTTPQATYTTSAGNIFHSNPIILDASGRVPSGGEIWLTDGLVYKFVLKDSNDVLIATYDNITGINSNFVAFTNQQEIQTAIAGQTVFNLTTMVYQPGTNSLSVFVDGVNQYGPGASYAYLETDSDTITFVSGLHVGAEVKFTTSNLNSSASVVDAAQISYLPPYTGSVATNVEAKLAQTVSIKDFGTDGDALVDALATNALVNIPADITSITLSTAQSVSVLPKLNMVAAEGDLTLNLATGTHTTTANNIANIGQNQKIFIQGATPVSTTLSSVDTVTGSAGNWTVTATLASASGIAINDVVKIDNVVPGRVYFPTTVGDRRPAANEMAIGFYAMGDVDTTTGGTTVNLSKSVAGSFLQAGDLVTIRGETRVVNTVGTNSFTVTSAFTYGVTSFQWWYYHIPNSGTITATASATVTGTSTLFTTEANIGDLLVVDGCSYKIVGITNNTSLTVSHAVTIPATSRYTIVTAGILHQGSFIVTNVIGNQITYTSKARYVPALPVKGVTGGTVTALKTVLRNTGTGDGFVFNRGAIIGGVKNVAIVGDNLTTTSVGVELNSDPTGDSGAYDLGSSVANLGANVSVINWGTGATLQSGCTLFAQNGHFCNNLSRGVSNEDGSTSYLREAVVSHNNGIGILGGGGYIRGSEAVICANTLQGLRINVGNGSYGDAWYAWGNGSHGFLAEGGCGIHFVDGYSNCNGGSGGNFQNGPSGRISRTWFGGNSNYAVSVTNGMVEGGQTWCSGTFSSSFGGVLVSKSNIDLNNSAQTGNIGIGIYAIAGARCYAENTFQARNNSNGIRSDEFGTLIMSSNSSSVNNGAANSSTNGGVLASPTNPYSISRITSHFTQSFTIADDAVASIDFGTTDVIRTVYLHSSSSASLQGAVRIRTVSSLGTTSIYGTGFTMNDYGTNPTGVLTGTTGVDGNITLSAANNGRFYIENRFGSSRVIIIDVMGS